VGAEAANSPDYLLVVYVHGWKHNAGWHDNTGMDDSDVENFRGALKQLSAAEIELSRRIEHGGVPRPARKIIGVFLDGGAPRSPRRH